MDPARDGPLAPLSDSAGEYASCALLERGGGLPGGDWAAWLSQLALMVAVGPISTYLLLVFPDGRLPSERWRPVAWFTVLTLILASAILVLVTPVGYFAPSVAVPSPVSLGIRIELDQSAQLRVAAILFVPVVMLCGAALVQRFRHSHGIERLQLKWIAYAAVIGAALWLNDVLRRPEPGPEPARLRLEISGARYSLDALTASRGTVTISVTNHDLFWHTFTIPELGVDLRVPVGDEKSVTFSAAPGDYHYICAVPGHASFMHGVLTVR